MPNIRTAATGLMYEEHTGYPFDPKTGTFFDARQGLYLYYDTISSTYVPADKGYGVSLSGACVRGCRIHLSHVLCDAAGCVVRTGVHNPCLLLPNASGLDSTDARCKPDHPP